MNVVLRSKKLTTFYNITVLAREFYVWPNDSIIKQMLDMLYNKIAKFRWQDTEIGMEICVNNILEINASQKSVVHLFCFLCLIDN